MGKKKKKVPESPKNFLIGGSMEFIDTASVVLVAQYDEGTHNTDGSLFAEVPGRELEYVSLWWRNLNINGVNLDNPGSRNPVTFYPDNNVYGLGPGKVPATSPLGGGHRSIDVQHFIPFGDIQIVAFWSTETNDIGLESASSNEIALTMDRRAISAFPSNLAAGPEWLPVDDNTISTIVTFIEPSTFIDGTPFSSPINNGMIPHHYNLYTRTQEQGGAPFTKGPDIPANSPGNQLTCLATVSIAQGLNSFVQISVTATMLNTVTEELVESGAPSAVVVLVDRRGVPEAPQNFTIG